MSNNPFPYNIDYLVQSQNLISLLCCEKAEFSYHPGFYDQEHIWITPANNDNKPHFWHHIYSEHIKVLGPLAKRFLSKVLGIGSAEHVWKEFKRNMGGNCSNLVSNKAKMQATIKGIHSSETNSEDRTRKSKAGTIMDDGDFDTLHMDHLCLPLDAAPINEIERRRNSFFCAWTEWWEDPKLTPKKIPIIEQRIISKYNSLKWVNPAHCKRNQGFMAHTDKASFQKYCGANVYELFSVLYGYNDNISDNEQDDMSEPWYQITAIPLIEKNYKEHHELRVTVYIEQDILKKIMMMREKKVVMSLVGNVPDMFRKCPWDGDMSRNPADKIGCLPNFLQNLVSHVCIMCHWSKSHVQYQILQI